jgi:homoprotocatechuate degradation regulator HpaR
LVNILINPTGMPTTFVHRNLPRLLLQARESPMARTRPSLRAHGLSDPQWRVLRVLGEHGAMETGRIAREAYILGPSLTGVLLRMERDGLIRRERDPADQRRTVVEARPRDCGWWKSSPTPSNATTTGWNGRWARKNSRSCTGCSMK